jgi:hypothetical protein
MLRFPLVVLTALLACTAAARAQDSPYVTHQERAIKALSEEETQGYLAGEGMGFALAAELNAYPGPRHVLQLADSLSLDPVRLDAVREIFQRMQQRAARLGKEIVGLLQSAGSRRVSSGRC